MFGTQPFLPAATLFVVAVVLASLRSRRVSTKLVAEIVAMLAIALVLLDRGTSPLPMAKPLTGRADAAWLRALAVVWWLIGARVVAMGAALLLGRDTRSRQARLFSDLVTGAIYLSAAYVIADSILDLPVRTLIATSGVVAVVLGLALQNTLADLFSGIAVEIEQPFSVGDTVSVDANLSGVVTDMTWRSVRLRTLGGDIATIPNSAIAKASVTNHSRPSERRSASVDIPIRSQASARRLIELLRQSLMLCPDVLETPEPTIRIKALDRFGPCFTLNYHVADSERLEEARGQVLRQARRLLRIASLLPGPTFDRRALLSDLPLFENLGTEGIAAIEAELTHHRFEPGEALIATGEQVDALNIVAAGILDISIIEAPSPRSIGRVGPGEYIGEVSMMTEAPSPATAIALTPVDIVRLSKASILRIVHGDPGLGRALEASVKRGVIWVERDAAARAVQPITDEQGFLRQLAAFFRLAQHRP